MWIKARRCIRVESKCEISAAKESTNNLKYENTMILFPTTRRIFGEMLTRLKCTNLFEWLCCIFVLTFLIFRVIDFLMLIAVPVTQKILNTFCTPCQYFYSNLKFLCSRRYVKPNNFDQLYIEQSCKYFTFFECVMDDAFLFKVGIFCKKKREAYVQPLSNTSVHRKENRSPMIFWSSNYAVRAFYFDKFLKFRTPLSKYVHFYCASAMTELRISITTDKSVFQEIKAIAYPQFSEEQFKKNWNYFRWHIV